MPKDGLCRGILLKTWETRIFYVLRFLSNFDSEFVEKICLKVPGNYSASIWIDNFSICVRENKKTCISMILGFLNPSPSPKTNYLSLETPGYLKEIKKIPKQVQMISFFITEFRKSQFLTILAKTGAEK